MLSICVNEFLELYQKSIRKRKTIGKGIVCMHPKWFDWIFRLKLRIWKDQLVRQVIYLKMKQSFYDKANDKIKTFTLWIQPFLAHFLLKTKHKKQTQETNIKREKKCVYIGLKPLIFCVCVSFEWTWSKQNQTKRCESGQHQMNISKWKSKYKAIRKSKGTAKISYKNVCKQKAF